MTPLFSPKRDQAMQAFKGTAITILVAAISTCTLPVDFVHTYARLGGLGAVLASTSCHSQAPGDATAWGFT
jgi:hypothetical protein